MQQQTIRDARGWRGTRSGLLAVGTFIGTIVSSITGVNLALAQDLTTTGPKDMAIGSNGLPFLAVSTSDPALFVLQCLDQDCSRVIEPAPVDSSSAVLRPIIAIRSDDRPLIAHSIGGSGGPSPRIFDCADQHCTQGLPRDITDAPLGSGGDRHFGMTLRSDDTAVLMFSDVTVPTAGVLTSYECLNPSCSDGTQTAITAAHGGSQSVSVRANDSLLVAAHVFPRLQTLDCEDAQCTGGALLDQARSTGSAIYNLMRADGTAFIAYTNGFDLSALSCTNSGCSATVGPTIIETISGGSSNIDVALTSGELPVIAYRTDNSTTLKLYLCADIDCLTGTAKVLDDSTGFKDNIALVIRADGRPLVIYDQRSADIVSTISCDDPDCTTSQQTNTQMVPDELFSDGFET